MLGYQVCPNNHSQYFSFDANIYETFQLRAYLTYISLFEGPDKIASICFIMCNVNSSE